MQTLRLCVFLAFIAALRAYELSRDMAEFYCIVNGNITDLEQVKEEGANRTLFDVRLQPVLAPALSPLLLAGQSSVPDMDQLLLLRSKGYEHASDTSTNQIRVLTVPVIYMLESISGVVVRALILIVTEGADRTIYTDPYNITGNTNIKPEALDSPQIKSLTLDDLHGQQDCKGSYTRVKPFVFVLNWPDCKHAAVNGQRASYSVTLTCDEASSIVPAGALEEPTLVPYRTKHQGHKYPLEKAPSNYV